MSDVEVFVVARDAMSAKTRLRATSLGEVEEGHVHGNRLRAEQHATALNLRILEGCKAYETYENTRVYVWSVVFDAELAGV